MTDPADLTPVTLVGLLADPGRLRVFAAVALGARTDAAAVTATGLGAREVAVALRRLASGGVVVATPDGWAVAQDRLQSAARAGAGHERTEQRDAADRSLHPFVTGRALRSLPASPTRRRQVLEHVATTTFVDGESYDEPAVDGLLRPWCATGEVDHAALRRYLVETGLLLRGGGVYALPTGGPAPEPGAGERYVQALGLS